MKVTVNRKQTFHLGDNNFASFEVSFSDVEIEDGRDPLAVVQEYGDKARDEIRRCSLPYSPYIIFSRADQPKIEERMRGMPVIREALTDQETLNQVRQALNEGATLDDIAKLLG